MRNKLLASNGPIKDVLDAIEVVIAGAERRLESHPVDDLGEDFTRQRAVAVLNLIARLRANSTDKRIDALALRAADLVGNAALLEIDVRDLLKSAGLGEAGLAFTYQLYRPRPDGFVEAVDAATRRRDAAILVARAEAIERQLAAEEARRDEAVRLRQEAEALA